MSAGTLDLAAPKVSGGPASSRAVVVTLARAEARRLLRSPLLWLGVGLSLLIAWTSVQAPEDWSGARYQSAPLVVGPLAVMISIVVAGSFHRERVGLAAEAPVGEGVRTAGRLLGAMVLVGLVALLTAAAAAWVRVEGGFDLGDEPGRTLHAQFTLGEVLQPVALALLAVAVGAAAGRRLRHRATAVLLLFVGWFPFVMVGWGFQGRRVTPFSIIQIQPISVPVGPVTDNPLDYPSWWLLSRPGEYQDHWARLFVSGQLAAGHVLWLLGLTCLFLAVAVPRGARTALLGAGLPLAVAGVVWQFAVIP